MNKPNYKEMTHEELRKYVLAHRDDDEAINELFVNRRDPNAKVYPANMSIEEMTQVIQERIKANNQSD